jgi:S1-C subfamily serine protease
VNRRHANESDTTLHGHSFVPIDLVRILSMLALAILGWFFGLSAAAETCNDCAASHAVVDPKGAVAAGDIDSDRQAYIRRAVRGPALPNSVTGKRQRASGSGFFVNGSDLVTNHHVIDGCSALTARIGDGGFWRGAVLLGSDAMHDLAVLRVDASVERAAILMSPRSGEPPQQITIIGYPELRRVVVRPVTVMGTIERPELWGRGAAFLLHAVVRHGHSGSPVVDPHGRVVGVVAKRVDPLSLYRKTGKVDDENIGVAVSAAVLEQFLREKDISFVTAEAGNTSRDQFIDPSSYVAQVGCWN